MPHLLQIYNSLDHSWDRLIIIETLFQNLLINTFTPTKLPFTIKQEVELVK